MDMNNMTQIIVAYFGLVLVSTVVIGILLSVAADKVEQAFMDKEDDNV
jgi:hypothetical protein